MSVISWHDFWISFSETEFLTWYFSGCAGDLGVREEDDQEVARGHPFVQGAPQEEHEEVRPPQPLNSQGVGHTNGEYVLQTVSAARLMALFGAFVNRGCMLGSTRCRNLCGIRSECIGTNYESTALYSKFHLDCPVWILSTK